MVLAGGYNESSRLSTIELAQPNAESTTLSVRLPVALSRSCIVAWDNDTFMVIGGYSRTSTNGRSETYFINIANNEVTNGPNLINERFEHACSQMIVNGEEFVVVTGGFGTGKRSTELLSKSNIQNGWQAGNYSV